MSLPFALSSLPLSLIPIQRQDGKVAVRNIRRESVDKIKAAEKDKDIGKDDSKGFQVHQSTDVMCTSPPRSDRIADTASVHVCSRTHSHTALLLFASSISST